MKKETTALLDIGWCEWVAFPDLKVPMIEARILPDTGISLLNVFDFSTFKEREDLMISFGIHPIQNNKDIEIYTVAPVKTRKLITVDKNKGERHWCYSIETPMCLGTIKKNIELFLVKELAGTFKLQLSAQAIRKKIRVNPHESHLAGRTDRSRQTVEVPG